jgi:4'-phosphopantetheinyl transferase EntD
MSCCETMLEGLLPDDVQTAWGDPRKEMPRVMPAEEALVANAVPKRRLEFAHGRVYARRALKHFGVENFALLSGPQREPIWPPGIVGSVTHTDGLCAVAAAEGARYVGIGIDVECDEPLEPKLAALVCGPEELGRQARATFLDPGVAARLSFSAKEAVYKCQFYLTRRVLCFSDVGIELEPDGTFRVRVFADVVELGQGETFVGRWTRRSGFLLTAAWMTRETI